MAGLILSTSSISAYLSCHYKYLLSSIYRVPAGQSLAAALGSAVHAGVEAFWKSPKRPQAAMRAVWEAQLAQVPLPYEEPPAAVYADGELMLGVYMGTVAKTFTPTLIEETFVVEVEGSLLSGTIDAADDDVHDLKTTAGKTINGRTPRFSPESYDLQLSLYSLGYQGLTGRKPKRLLLDVLTRRGTYRQYERPPQVGELLDVVGVVRDGIMAEDYEPTGAINGACHWCPYANGACRYVTL